MIEDQNLMKLALVLLKHCYQIFP